MAKHRFFLISESWSGDLIEINSEVIQHQILKVLRLKLGAKIVALDNSGLEFESVLVSVKPLRFHIISQRTSLAEPKIKIHLWQSLIKKDKFEWVLQKGTEAGISAFTPVLAARSEKKDLSNQDRLRRIVVEAVEQSGRAILPELNLIVNFDKIEGEPGALNIALDQRGLTPLNQVYVDAAKAKRVNLVCGPEGGFSDEELKFLFDKGFQSVNLGPRILRAETAGLAAAAAILISNL